MTALRSVVVNGMHVWECSSCGRRWLPSQTRQAETHTCKPRR